jgi:hypothetical protein
MELGALRSMKPRRPSRRQGRARAIVRFTAWTTYRGTNCLGPTAYVDEVVHKPPQAF